MENLALHYENTIEIMHTLENGIGGLQSLDALHPNPKAVAPESLLGARMVFPERLGTPQRTREWRGGRVTGSCRGWIRERFPSVGGGFERFVETVRMLVQGGVMSTRLTDAMRVLRDP
jgi:hypothetical protein